MTVLRLDIDYVCKLFPFVWSEMLHYLQEMQWNKFQLYNRACYFINESNLIYKPARTEIGYRRCFGTVLMCHVWRNKGPQVTNSLLAQHLIERLVF